MYEPLVDATLAECEFGGTTVLVGRDDDGDGRLEEDEATSTQIVCGGAPGERGERGEQGVPGTSALIRTTDEPSGTNCVVGGIRLDVGLDENANGTLDATEIDAAGYVCNGIAGLTSLTRTSTTVAECDEAGGLRIETGLDDDRDGVLSEQEVLNSNYVCNGDDGAISLVEVDDEAPGTQCPAGGQRVRTGVDADGDGGLSEQEIRDVEYVCEPLRTLLRLGAEPAGPNCAGGGTRSSRARM